MQSGSLAALRLLLVEERVEVAGLVLDCEGSGWVQSTASSRNPVQKCDIGFEGGGRHRMIAEEC